MTEIGVQTHNVVADKDPAEGFETLRRAGFTCCDFSLNGYLKNTSLYEGRKNTFFDQSVEVLREHFREYKKTANAAGIRINQMHMPYPIFVPNDKKNINPYLRNVVAPKSMQICDALECPYIVVHGFKLAHHYGSEEAEWECTEDFLDTILPAAKELGITVCIENLYTSIGGRLVEGPCCDARKAAERIDRINEKYGAEVLGYCFDTGHANIVGIDFEDFIVRLGQRLKVLHIHDNDGVRDLHQIPFAFTRERTNAPATDWEGFVRGLRSIDFDGVLSFETAPVLMSFPDAMKQDVLGFIAKIGKFLADELQKV